MFSVAKYQPLAYEGKTYPKWAEGVGWIIAGYSLSYIPITAVLVLCEAEGSVSEVCEVSCLWPVWTSLLIV